MSEKVLIEITQTPDGPAPEWVRKTWIGVQMLARLLPPDEIEADFTNNKPIGNRGGIAVNPGLAIQCLATHSEEAAKWFQENVPPGMPFLSFGPTEFKVV